MHRENLVFWCCALLFVVSSSKHRRNLTNDNKKDDSTMHENSTKDVQYDDMQYESHTMSNYWENNDSMRYELETHFIKNHENDNQILMESRTNSTEINDKKNFTSQEIYENSRNEDKSGSTSYDFFKNFNTDNNKNNFVPYEMCNNITCIQLCCPLDDRMIKDKCIAEENEYLFSNLYRHINDLLPNEYKRADELFQLVVHDPCGETELSFLLDLSNRTKYMILANGSLYLPYYNILVESTFYCLTVVDQNKFNMTICSRTMKKLIKKEINDPDNALKQVVDNIIIFWILNLVSMMFLLITFLVYSILPELRNLRGFILRSYCGVMFVAYIADIINNSITLVHVVYPICVTIALINYFCFLATCFWLSVMSFDMWWTFRDFRSLQRNMKQRERKKLIMYSVYAWGSPFIFTIICIIMNFVPSVSKYLIEPKLGVLLCWFNEEWASMLYYWPPAIVCVFSSIYLFILTALKIARYEKDTAHQMKDSENRLYDENKKWFKLYMKLFIIVFIVMGISSFMEIVSWFMAIMSWEFPYFVSIIQNILYITYSLDLMQNFGIFFIFVCKKTIKQLLLKRFGKIAMRKSLPKIRQTVVVTNSSIGTTTSGIISLSEEVNLYKQANHFTKNLRDDTHL